MDDLCHVMDHYESVHAMKKKMIIRKLEKNPITIKNERNVSNILAKYFKEINANSKKSILNNMNDILIEDFDATNVACVVSDISNAR